MNKNYINMYNIQFQVRTRLWEHFSEKGGSTPGGGGGNTPGEQPSSTNKDRIHTVIVP